MGLRPLACWDCGFESHQGHGCLSVLSVVCCQVEITATSWSLVQRSPTDCDASLCVCVCDLQTSRMRRPWPVAPQENNKIIVLLLLILILIIIITQNCSERHLDWTERDQPDSVTFGEADSLVMWSHLDLSEPVTKGRNSGNKISDHGRSKFRTKTYGTWCGQPPTDYTKAPSCFVSHSRSSGFQPRLNIYAVLLGH